MRWVKLVSVLFILTLTISSAGYMLYISPVAASDSQDTEADAYNPVIDEIIQKVDLQSLYGYTYDLQNFTTRYAYTTNLNQSADYLFSEFSSNPNVVVESQYFEYDGIWVRNVICTVPAFNPANKTVYILSGHYDSISGSPMTNAPGADDDASGTAAAVEAARVLSGYRLNATVVLAAWTAEELGLHGARHYAKQASARGMDIGGMIQLDMIGYDPLGFLGLRAYSNFESNWLLNEFDDANNDYSIGVNLVPTIDPTATASDHAPFWDEGYPAIMAIETDFNDYYHSTQDTVDKMSFDLVTRTTQVSIATVAKIAGVLTPGVGYIALDRSSYNPSDAAEISIYDTDLNTNPGTVETVQVNIRSAGEPFGENILLSEVGPDEGVFKGTVPLTLASPSPGALTVLTSDKLNATYWEDNPKGLRWVNADVDGVLPEISNVAAIPSVTTAVITWDTNEDTDSLVDYGLTTAMGSSESDLWRVRSHSIYLSGLNPGTRYYFEVTSTDFAGNQAFDDNDGTKYSFVTLDGVSSTPAYGYVGWVREEEPTGNHFTDPEIIVGYSNRRHTTYLGAAQFQVTPIPDNAVITNASLQLYGGRWIYDEADYQWNVTLLNASIDAGWTGHSYGEIDVAPVDTILTPVLDDWDLTEGEWDHFYFLPSGYMLLREHFNNSVISFRVNGPTSETFFADGLIFAWVSGNEGGAGFTHPLSPRLTVTYTFTGDVTGPDTINQQINRENGAGEPAVRLTATTTDAGTGNSNITNVEYYVGTDPGEGNGMAMAPVDGAFDTPSEDSTITIDVSEWLAGTYDFYIRGRDEAGNWGPSSQIANVLVDPPAPPSSIDATLEGAGLEDVNITWSLSPDDGAGDNDIDHYAVYYDDEYDRGAESYRYLASIPAGSQRYVHSLAGNGDSNSYFYVVLANDTSGNAGRTHGQASKFARNLDIGMHVVSNPLIVSDYSIDSILQTVSFDRVWQYNAVDPWAKVDLIKPYAKSFITTNDMSFWVQISAISTFIVAGKVPDIVSVTLKTGWNLVSYQSLIPRDVVGALLGISYARVEGYDGTAVPYNLKEMSDWDYLYAGNGYWIHSNEDTTWMLSN